MCGYALAPEHASLLSLSSSVVGTGLSISSANIFNQWLEYPYDGQMRRTRNRALVRYAVSPMDAFYMACFCGVSGVSLLYYAVNPVCAALAGANIVLYAAIYTPLKRITIVNTWIGSIVGAIPPVIGWAACTGGDLSHPGAWILAFILYAWQFVHFNALSHTLRGDYSQAGYQMLAVLNPRKNVLVALRYSILMTMVTPLSTLTGTTDIYFLIDSSVLNLALSLKAAEWYHHPKREKCAKDLFFMSLVHLPLLLAAMIYHRTTESGTSAGHRREVEIT